MSGRGAVTRHVVQAQPLKPPTLAAKMTRPETVTKTIIRLVGFFTGVAAGAVAGRLVWKLLFS